MEMEVAWSCCRETLSISEEDSPSGLWRTLGKRVGCKPSGVRIPHPPPLGICAPRELPEPLEVGAAQLPDHLETSVTHPIALWAPGRLIQTPRRDVAISALTKSWLYSIVCENQAIPWTVNGEELVDKSVGFVS